MNFLIFDSGSSSSALIDSLLGDFDHITLFTSKDSSTAVSSSSSFLTIKQGHINNAREILETLAKHEDDPFNAILIFPSSSSTLVINNLIEAMKRHESPPRLFLFIDAKEWEVDNDDYPPITTGITSKNENQMIVDALKASSSFIKWTIVVCGHIEVSLSNKKMYDVISFKYRIDKTKEKAKRQERINDIDVLKFLLEEIKNEHFLNKIIYLSSDEQD